MEFFRHQIGIIRKQLGVTAVSEVFSAASRGCVLLRPRLKEAIVDLDGKALPSMQKQAWLS
jgi:hypothetical protein